MTRLLSIAQTLTLGVSLIALGVLMFYTPAVSLTEVAQAFVAHCSTAINPEECYEKEVPTLLEERPVEEVFGVIRAIRAMDPNYQFCHVLAHKLGERIVERDPNAWVEAIPLNPADGLCSNGFIHGVVGGRFRAEVLDPQTIEGLLPDFARACEPRKGWSPTDLDRAICYHGMGHLFTFITDADLSQAVNICKSVVALSGSEGMLKVCREGVFMQIYQPLEPDDFLLIERMPEKPTKETVGTFCARYPDEKDVGACLRESWPLFREEVTSGEGVDQFCAMSPASEIENCYFSALTIIGRFSLNHSATAHPCGSVSEDRQGQCYGIAAQAILEENRSNVEGAIAFCGSLTEPDRNLCFERITRLSGFLYGKETPAKQHFCGLLPEEHRAQCVSF